MLCFFMLFWLFFVQSPFFAFLCCERLISVDHITQGFLPSGFYLVSANLEALAHDERKEKERGQVFISPLPTPPPACLWLLAVPSFLYLRPQLQSDNPVPWLRVLASSRNCFCVPSGLRMVVVSSWCESLDTLPLTSSRKAYPHLCKNSSFIRLPSFTLGVCHLFSAKSLSNINTHIKIKCTFSPYLLSTKNSISINHNTRVEMWCKCHSLTKYILISAKCLEICQSLFHSNYSITVCGMKANVLIDLKSRRDFYIFKTMRGGKESQYYSFKVEIVIVIIIIPILLIEPSTLTTWLLEWTLHIPRCCCCYSGQWDTSVSDVCNI